MSQPEPEPPKAPPATLHPSDSDSDSYSDSDWSDSDSDSGPSGPNVIASLPDDVFVKHVLNSLGLEDRMTCREVCKSWRDLISPMPALGETLIVTFAHPKGGAYWPSDPAVPSRKSLMFMSEPPSPLHNAKAAPKKENDSDPEHVVRPRPLERIMCCGSVAAVMGMNEKDTAADESLSFAALNGLLRGDRWFGFGRIEFLLPEWFCNSKANAVEDIPYTLESDIKAANALAGSFCAHLEQVLRLAAGAASFRRQPIPFQIMINAPEPLTLKENSLQIKLLAQAVRSVPGVGFGTLVPVSFGPVKPSEALKSLELPGPAADGTDGAESDPDKLPWSVSHLRIRGRGQDLLAEKEATISFMTKVSESEELQGRFDSLALTLYHGTASPEVLLQAPLALLSKLVIWDSRKMGHHVANLVSRLSGLQKIRDLELHGTRTLLRGDFSRDLSSLLGSSSGLTGLTRLYLGVEIAATIPDKVQLKYDRLVNGAQLRAGSDCDDDCNDYRESLIPFIEKHQLGPSDACQDLNSFGKGWVLPNLKQLTIDFQVHRCPLLLPDLLVLDCFPVEPGRRLTRLEQLRVIWRNKFHPCVEEAAINEDSDEEFYDEYGDAGPREKLPSNLGIMFGDSLDTLRGLRVLDIDVSQCKEPSSAKAEQRWYHRCSETLDMFPWMWDRVKSSQRLVDTKREPLMDNWDAQLPLDRWLTE